MLGGDAPLHAFTALGTIADDEIVQVEMTPDFRLFRRNVKYLYTGDVKIEPLIDDLRFIRNKKSWGYAFRFGLLEIERTILRKSCRDSKKRDKRLNETDGVLQKTDDWTSFLREGSNPFPWIDIIRDGNRADHKNWHNIADFLFLLIEIAQYEHLTPPDAEAQSRLSRGILLYPPSYEVYIGEICRLTLSHSI